MNIDNCLKLKKEFHQLKIATCSSSPDYLDLSIVNPDIEPEKQIIDKLLEFSLQKRAHKYSSAQGLPELRQAIAGRYQKKFGITLDWQNNITISRGTNAAIASCIELFSRKYQRRPRILIPNPTYSMHLEVSRKFASECFFYQTDQSEIDLIKDLHRQIGKHKIDILLLNFPNNPTGQIVSEAFYENLTTRLSDIVPWIINDFVYGELTYYQEFAPSLLSANYKGNLIEIYSLSKSFSLPGWRLSLVLSNSKIITELIEQQTEIDYGSYQGFQRAASFALSADTDYSKIAKNIYQKRSNFLLEKLRNSEIQAKINTSGCFLWCQLPSNIQLSSYTFCKKLLLEKKLAFQPGEIFGDQLERFFRISLTASEEELSLAVERLNKFLPTI